MKAAQFNRYGPPEKVLSVVEVEKPTPKQNEVLIKVKATTVNDYDWSLVRGKPHIYRLMFGLTKPKNPIIGMELAGVVEAIGDGVKRLKAGDAVFGDTSEYGFGTFAEYICLNENAVIKKPEEISFVQAAALPHAATLAFQALKGIGKIKQGQKVLINGGGGGVGTLGLQLAKLYNCEVTGVDAKEKHHTMKELGFDHVLDYRTTNFTKTKEKYDLILDCKTCYSGLSYPRALTKNGKYISIGGYLNKLLSVLFWGMFVPIFSSKKLRILALKTNKGLDEISQLVIKGKLTCKIDGPYDLEESPRLVQYFGDGKHEGKIVVTPITA